MSWSVRARQGLGAVCRSARPLWADCDALSNDERLQAAETALAVVIGLPTEWFEKSPHGSLLCAAKSAHYSQQNPKFLFRCAKLKSNVALEHLVII